MRSRSNYEHTDSCLEHPEETIPIIYLLSMPSILSISLCIDCPIPDMHLIVLHVTTNSWHRTLLGLSGCLNIVSCF